MPSYTFTLMKELPCTTAACQPTHKNLTWNKKTSPTQKVCKNRTDKHQTIGGILQFAKEKNHNTITRTSLNRKKEYPSFTILIILHMYKQSQNLSSMK